MGSISEEHLEPENYLQLVAKDPDSRLCTHEPPHCTDLLNDPAGVLSDRRRWPDHLCYGAFFQESVERWCRQITPLPDPAVDEWRGEWPLPVGEKAVWRRAGFYIRHPMSVQEAQEFLGMLLGLVPFTGDEEAIWALRIENSSGTLDLFGRVDYVDAEGASDQELAMPPYTGVGRVTFNVPSQEPHNKEMGPKEFLAATLRDWSCAEEVHQEYVAFAAGELLFMMRGRDTSLTDLLNAAARWWSTFKGWTIVGRPKNSGVWTSTKDFREGLRQAVETIRSNGGKVTQEHVADRLITTDRQLRRWCKDYGISWQEVRQL